MSYASGSLSNANPASAYLALLDTLILSVTGWSKVSSAIVVGTNTWNVYKSAGANNSFGSDFYVALGYVTATPTSILHTIFEGWNTGTLLATNFPPNTGQIPTGVYANPNAAAALPSTGTTMAYMQTGVLTTSCSYFHSVTADRIVFGIQTTTPTSIGRYIGLYDSFNTLAVDPFPLCSVDLMSAASVGAAVTVAATALTGLATREPAQSATSTLNFAVASQAGPTSSWTQLASVIDIYKGFYYLSRQMLTGRVTAAFRGLLKDMFLGPAQSNNGDTITWSIAGTPYVATRVGTSTYGCYVLQI